VTATHFDVRLLEAARKQIGELIESRSGALIQGIATDYADYRYRAGQIDGFQTSLDLLAEIVREMGDQRS
jgi:hypothetical protein